MLVFPNKKLRASVIRQYVEAAGYRGVVCFSCGNASWELKQTGLYVVDVSPCGDLQPTKKWWQPEEIRRCWPDLFDATSGHLPAFLMARIATRFRLYIGDLDPQMVHQVPTGSGETILCLRWAYPECKFEPIFGLGPGTERNENSPLLHLTVG